MSVGWQTGWALRPDGTIDFWRDPLGFNGPFQNPAQCGVCGNGVVDPAERCDDGNLVSNDGCSAGCEPDCPATPTPGCHASVYSRLVIRDSDDDAKDRLAWSWESDSPISMASVTDPTTEGDYLLCLYPDESALGNEVRLNRQAGWRGLSNGGYGYTDSSGSNEGIGEMRLELGDERPSRLSVRGLGMSLSDDLLPHSSYRVQLVDPQTGSCWDSTFPTGSLRNGQYRAKSNL